MKIGGDQVKCKLEECILSKRCDKTNCLKHRLYDSSVNGDSKQPCEGYLSLEETFWSGWSTGEEVIGYRTISLPKILS